MSVGLQCTDNCIVHLFIVPVHNYVNCFLYRSSHICHPANRVSFAKELCHWLISGIVLHHYCNDILHISFTLLSSYIPLLYMVRLLKLEYWNLEFNISIGNPTAWFFFSIKTEIIVLSLLCLKECLKDFYLLWYSYCRVKLMVN